MAEITLKGEVGFDINISQVQGLIKSLGEFEDLTINLTTVGGNVEEATKIYDYLKSLGKPITTKAVGYCFSCGLNLLFVANPDKRFAANKETRFCAHNADIYDGYWLNNSDEAKELVIAIEETTNKMVALYTASTGLAEDEIRSLMKNDDVITAEAAIGYNFISQILEEETEYDYFFFAKNKIAAKSYANQEHKQLLIKNKSKMDTKELSEKLEKQEGLIGKILGFVEKAFAHGIKALKIATEEGVEIEFQGEELIEGVAVTSDTPDGTYTLMYADKKWTVVIENKIVTTITEIAMDEPTDDVEAIKAENEALKQKIAELEGITAKAEKLEAEVKAIRAITSKFEKPDGTYEFKAEGQETLTPEQEVKAKAKEAVQRYKEKNNL
jgi:ATP-dependent Clp protease protease subunit